MQRSKKDPLHLCFSLQFSKPKTDVLEIRDGLAECLTLPRVFDGPRQGSFGRCHRRDSHDQSLLG